MRMLPEQRQTMLFSATMPGPIIALSRAFLNRPTHIRAEESDPGLRSHERTRQLVYRAHAMDKVELLTRVLQAEGRGLTMIFARTKRTVQRVADDLAERGFAAAAVHGDLGQGAREQALRAFRSGKVDVLVATDVAARGIDVTDVTHVINYQCPEDEKTYVHRIGRTGRAGKEGVAVTLVDWDDMPRWKMVSDELGLGIDEPAETYSTSEHLYTDLAIPTSATGRLPLAKRTRAGLAAEYVDSEGDVGGGRKPRSRTRTRGEHAEPTTPVPRPQAAQPHPWRAQVERGGRSPPAPAEAPHPTAGPESVADADGKPRRRRRRGGAGRRGRASRSPTPAPRTPPRARPCPADHDRALAPRRPRLRCRRLEYARTSRPPPCREPSGSRSPSPVIHGTPPSAERPTRRTRTAPPSPLSDGGAVTSSWRWRSSCCWSSRRSWCGAPAPRSPPSAPPTPRRSQPPARRATCPRASPRRGGPRAAPRRAPVVAGPVVVTGDGGTVAGHDAATGAVAWSYRRDLALCTVGAGFPGTDDGDGHALALYEGRTGWCSELTALHPSSGTRADASNPDMHPGVQLLADGSLRHRDRHRLPRGVALRPRAHPRVRRRAHPRAARQAAASASATYGSTAIEQRPHRRDRTLPRRAHRPAHRAHPGRLEGRRHTRGAVLGRAARQPARCSWRSRATGWRSRCPARRA